MTICAVIQPSYMPWRGYFDQIMRSDIFVFYDDVQFDRHGWRNRNRVKTPTGSTWLTVPVRSKGHLDRTLLLNEIEIADETNWHRRHLTTLYQSYRKAPFFHQYIELVEKHLDAPPKRLCDLTIPLTIDLARELGATCDFVTSSSLSVGGTGLAKLISTLQSVRANHYLSGPSAASYIDPSEFASAGIRLEYVKYNYREYSQLHPPFDGNVSIVDLLFMLGENAVSAFSES